jgi:ABC-type multidrug transport system fused ATPase/permease subunit
MAAEKKQMTPEEKKREKERLALEKAELAEREKRKKERDKRKKRREAKLNKKIKQEKKRIRKEINFPYKILNLVISMLTLLILIFFLFVTDMSIISIVKWTAFLLLVQYLVFGGAMSVYVYMLAEDKKLELIEMAKQEEMNLRIEEDLIKQQELQELQDLEKEIKERRMAETLKLKNKTQKELQASYDEVPGGIIDEMLGETDLDNPTLPEFNEPKENYDIDLELGDVNQNAKTEQKKNIKIPNLEMDLEMEDSGEAQLEGNQMKEFIPLEDYPDIEKHGRNE